MYDCRCLPLSQFCSDDCYRDVFAAPSLSVTERMLFSSAYSAMGMTACQSYCVVKFMERLFQFAVGLGCLRVLSFLTLGLFQSTINAVATIVLLPYVGQSVEWKLFLRLEVPVLLLALITIFGRFVRTKRIAAAKPTKSLDTRLLTDTLSFYDSVALAIRLCPLVVCAICAT